MVLGVMAILMGMLIPSVGVVRQKAQRMATGQKMRQIGLGIAAYQNITGQALKAGSLGAWIGELATETGIREGKLYLFEEDPLVAASLDSIPPVLVRKTGVSSWTVIEGFDAFPVGIVAASGVSPMSNPSTTPVAWTRGLTTDGYWLGHDSERAGIYGDEGGFIVFLDGHVEFFRNLEKDGGQLAPVQTRAEQQSFANLLESSQSEQESVSKMLASAQKRLGQMDILEHDVIRLEAETAQLNHDYSMAKQEVETLQRDVAELDELKVQNRELAEVLKSMENSRKQYEIDAKRYRETAEQAEQKSETLRLRLDDVEKNFQDFERQQREALKDARKSSVPRAINGKKKKVQRDNLQEIVGIGKVFEHALNELGIYTFSQIANFDITDIARVNASLKGSEGRMEADDWIGQARELHFKKYGDSEVA